MSGRRARALRRAFIKENGRTPAKAKLLGWRDHEAVWDRDEMRRARKDYVRGVR